MVSDRQAVGQTQKSGALLERGSLSSGCPDWAYPRGPAMLRITCLCLLSLTLAAADNLTPDALYGIWVVDEKALTKDQKDAAASAAQVENFGVNLTLRTARFIFAKDSVVAGAWRLDQATPTTATLVVQPKGGEERRFTVTLKKGQLVVDQCPGKLPMKNAR